MEMKNPCLCGQSWLLAGELESWPRLTSPRSEVLLTVRTGDRSIPTYISQAAPAGRPGVGTGGTEVQE